MANPNHVEMMKLDPTGPGLPVIDMYPFEADSVFAHALEQAVYREGA